MCCLFTVCTCNMEGSLDNDCDPMSGKCLCKNEEIGKQYMLQKWTLYSGCMNRCARPDTLKNDQIIVYFPEQKLISLISNSFQVVNYVKDVLKAISITQYVKVWELRIKIFFSK